MSLLSKSATRAISFGMLCMACTALTPVAAHAQDEAAAEAAEPDAAEPDPAEEIVVTATRRTLKLNDVPLSISALAQDTLVTRGVRDSADIAYVAPGLSVINDNDGSEQISVRGIVALGSTATTALYIDETPISQSGGGAFSPRYFDIERVEVLRGPQGTLFGASAMGGAIRVINKRPHLSRFEGAVRAEGSTTRLGKENYVADGAVSVPVISDVLAFRVTGFYEKQSGWVKAFSPIFSDDPNDYSGLNADGTVGTGVAFQGITGPEKRVGDQTVYGARAALLLQPVDTLKLTATYHWQKRKNDGFNNADKSIGLGLPGSNLRQARSADEFRNLRTQLANLTGELDAGFAKLTSSTSYEWNRETNVTDLSATAIPNAVNLFGALPRAADGRAGAPQRSQQKKTNFTQEVRLVSSGDSSFNWILGAFYNRSRNDLFQSYQVRGVEASVVGSAFEGLFPGDIVGTTTSRNTTRETSFFGEVGYKFSDKLSATLGLRRYSVTTGLASDTTGLIAADPVRLSAKEDGLTYKAILNYKPTDDLLLFAGYTTGYRPGGPNPKPFLPEDIIPPSFKSDKLAQYEIGWKSSWLDRTLTVNGALFYIDWSDIPTQVRAFSGLGYTVNGPKARNYGGELELVVRPTKGFDVSFGLTVLNAKYSRNFVDPSGSGLQISKGQKLPNIPNITLNAGLNYEWFIGDDIRARIGANVVHVTKRSQTANEFVSPLPGFVNAGLSAGIDFGTFDVSIFARNVFDTRAIVSNTAVGSEIAGGIRSSLLSQSHLQPRTIGASIQLKF